MSRPLTSAVCQMAVAIEIASAKGVVGSFAGGRVRRKVLSAEGPGERLETLLGEIVEALVRFWSGGAGAGGGGLRGGAGGILVAAGAGRAGDRGGGDRSGEPAGGSACEAGEYGPAGCGCAGGGAVAIRAV